MRMRWIVLALLLCPAALLSDVKVKLLGVKPEVVQERVRGYQGNDTQREATLKGFFEAAGCNGEQLTEQSVKGLKQHNLICTLPGDTDSVILLGAHYDHVDAGDGVIDNWSGASLLPSFYEALKTTKRRYTLIFAAFAGEEKGLVGSRFYVKNMTAESLHKVRAMICIDTLGLGPTEAWVSISDKELVGRLAVLAHAINMPISRVDVDGVGMSDEEPFLAKKIPVVMVHTITPATLSVLHTPRDSYKQLKFDDYYTSYRLLSAYLNYLDQTLDPSSSSHK
jgi:aminopeptidase-like protein